MILKDRYSNAMIFLALSTGMSIHFLRTDKGYLSAISLLVGISPLLYLLTRPAKIHLSDEQKINPDFQVKGENDCGFKSQVITKIDGIKINNKRFKAVNGTDVFIKDNSVKVCGFGSALIQSVGGGGIEPKSIQSDVCWE